VNCCGIAEGHAWSLTPLLCDPIARHMSCDAQVMPFILRRTKDQVLRDLPPKIIQDVYVDPSALQRRLYEDFSASSASRQAMSAVRPDASIKSAASKAPHVFQVNCSNQHSDQQLLHGSWGMSLSFALCGKSPVHC
jgi:hypothetical protein